MNVKFIIVFIGAVLLTQTGALVGQQIPPNELPSPGTDTGLEGKYDPQNGIAQLIQDKSAEAARSKIFEDEHVLVFMPLPGRRGGHAGSRAGGSETIAVRRSEFYDGRSRSFVNRPRAKSATRFGKPGTRNLLGLKPDEMRN